jgi:ABC-2 type transport system ATP-binding protein
MSTHQMHQVEELCDRILLINNGHSVLYGDLEAIREDYSGHAVLVKTRGDLPDLPGVVADGKVQGNGYSRLTLAPEVAPQDILKSLVERGTMIEAFEIAVPTLDEIFIRAVRGEGVPA